MLLVGLQLAEMGIEVVCGDIKKTRSLGAVFAGATGAYFATPTTEGKDISGPLHAQGAYPITDHLTRVVVVVVLYIGSSALFAPPAMGMQTESSASRISSTCASSTGLVTPSSSACAALVSERGPLPSSSCVQPEHYKSGHPLILHWPYHGYWRVNR